MVKGESKSKVFCRGVPTPRKSETREAEAR